MKSNSKISSLKLLLDLWKFINPRRKKKLILLFMLMILSGVLEVFTLSVLLPFLMVIIDPTKLYEFDFAKNLIIFFNISSYKNALLPLTLLFAFAVIFSASVRLANLWLNSKLVAEIGSDISNRIYNIYLKKNYEFHVNNNYSQLISNLTENINV